MLVCAVLGVSARGSTRTVHPRDPCAGSSHQPGRVSKCLSPCQPRDGIPTEASMSSYSSTGQPGPRLPARLVPRRSPGPPPPDLGGERRPCHPLRPLWSRPGPAAAHPVAAAWGPPGRLDPSPKPLCPRRRAPPRSRDGTPRLPVPGRALRSSERPPQGPVPRSSGPLEPPRDCHGQTPPTPGETP